MAGTVGPQTIPPACSSGASGVCSACFQEYVHNDTSSWSRDSSVTEVVCATDENGVPLARCSGLARVDAFGNYCRSQCNSSANTGACEAGAQKYCGNFPGNQDCRCLAPHNTTYGTGSNVVNYDSLANFVAQNPISVDPRCMYPACAPHLVGIIYKESLKGQCPTFDVYCSVGNFTVTMQDIQAGKVNVVSQNCGTQASGGGNGATSEGGLSSKDKTIVLAGVAAAIVLLVVFLGFFVWVRRQQALFHKDVLLRTGRAPTKHRRREAADHKRK